LRGQNSLSIVSSYPMLLDVALYGTEWSGVVQYRKCLLWKGKDRPKWVGFKWVGLDSLTSHPTSHAVIPLISSDAALCNWLEPGWLVRRSPGGNECLRRFKPLFAEPIPLLQRADKQPRNINTSSSSLYMYIYVVLPVAVRYGGSTG
jgi:hypothetical protein